jgi:hypothetical protein
LMRTIFLMCLAMLWMILINTAEQLERLLHRSAKPVVVLFHIGKRNLFMIFVRVRYRGIKRKKYLVVRRLWRQYRKNRYLSPEDVLILKNLESDGYVVGWWPRPIRVATSEAATIKKIVWINSKRPAK